MDPFSPEFLRTEIVAIIRRLDPATPALWGKMNAWQMVEHLSDFIGISTGQISFPLSIPEEQLPKYREFLFSNKEFRENTKAPDTVLGEEPLPVRQPSFTAAADQLEKTVNEFFTLYENDPTRKALHPAFGELDYQGWLVLHGKHARHHLRQFGLL